MSGMFGAQLHWGSWKPICTGKSTKEAQPGSRADQELGFPEVNLSGGVLSAQKNLFLTFIVY